LPNSYGLKTRLTLLNTVILVIALGAGGFFLHSSQQRQLLNHLDAELLSVAQEVSCIQRDTASGDDRQKSICQSLDQFALYRRDGFMLSLLTADGRQLCSNLPLLTSQTQFPATETTPSTAGNISFATISSDSGDGLRRLTFPISVGDTTLLQLQISTSLSPVAETTRFFALSLFAFGLLIIICVSISQWLLLNLMTKPINRLIQLMAHTTEENIPRYFQGSKLHGRELRQLSTCYNNLIERLALSLRKAQQFSADVTHELRTPLTILRGETELALRGNKSKEQLQQTLSSNLEEISRMRHLIEDLLLLSKSELGEVPLKMEAIDLGSLLDELHFQATIIAEEKQIQVHMQHSEEQISLLADGLRLRQVFLNLLTNAIKYTPQNGSVTMNWSLQKNYARIIIEDTGIGIDPKHQQHIFDRFYRIDKTSNRNDGGSGLGLAIAKWIVDAHHGSIWICSEPGQGSCFTVLLPLTHRPRRTEKENTAH